MSILIIEDDPDIRSMLSFALRLEGYKTLCASNGVEALDLLARESNVGLVLLDLMMPVMNGWEFRAAQLADPRYRQIPVVVISGDVDAEARQKEIRAADYLVKPIELETLLSRVAKYIHAAS